MAAMHTNSIEVAIPKTLNPSKTGPVLDGGGSSRLFNMTRGKGETNCG